MPPLATPTPMLGIGAAFAAPWFIARGVSVTFFLHSAGIAIGQLRVRQVQGKINQARGPRAF